MQHDTCNRSVANIELLKATNVGHPEWIIKLWNYTSTVQLDT